MKGFLDRLYSMYGCELSEGFEHYDLKERGFKFVYNRDTAPWTFDKDFGRRRFFLVAAQNYMNDKFEHDGYLFLNEVLDYIGIESTKIGREYGWSKKLGDSAIDFGFVDFICRAQIWDLDTAPDDIVLNFNCNSKPITDYCYAKYNQI